MIEAAASLRDDFGATDRAVARTAIDGLVRLIAIHDAHLDDQLDLGALWLAGNCTFTIDWQRSSSQSLLLEAPRSLPDLDHTALLRGLACGRAWFEELATGKVTSFVGRVGVHESYVARMIDLAFVEPSVVEAVLSGAPLPGVNVGSLTVTGE